MNRAINHYVLFATLSGVLIGCGGNPGDVAADRFEGKKSEWRRKRVQAEERFAEIAERLSVAQRERLHVELCREFDAGERELGSALR